MIVKIKELLKKNIFLNEEKLIDKIFSYESKFKEEPEDFKEDLKMFYYLYTLYGFMLADYESLDDKGRKFIASDMKIIKENLETIYDKYARDFALANALFYLVHTPESNLKKELLILRAYRASAFTYSVFDYAQDSRSKLFKNIESFAYTGKSNFSTKDLYFEINEFLELFALYDESLYEGLLAVVREENVSKSFYDFFVILVFYSHMYRGARMERDVGYFIVELEELLLNNTIKNGGFLRFKTLSAPELTKGRAYEVLCLVMEMLYEYYPKTINFDKKRIGEILLDEGLLEEIIKEEFFEEAKNNFGEIFFAETEHMTTYDKKVYFKSLPYEKYKNLIAEINSQLSNFSGDSTSKNTYLLIEVFKSLRVGFAGHVNVESLIDYTREAIDFSKVEVNVLNVVNNLSQKIHTIIANDMDLGGTPDRPSNKRTVYNLSKEFLNSFRKLHNKDFSQRMGLIDSFIHMEHNSGSMLEYLYLVGMFDFSIAEKYRFIETSGFERMNDFFDELHGKDFENKVKQIYSVYKRKI